MVKGNDIFGQWIQVFAVSGEQQISETIKRIKELDDPKFVAGVEVPKDYDNLTIGQVLDLQSPCPDGVFLNPSRVVLGLTDEQIYKAKTMDVLKMVAMDIRQMERIQKAFMMLNREPTQQELKAGIDKLYKSPNEIIYYYAQKWGITNPDDARDANWKVVWDCMMGDKSKSEFETRLQKVYSDEASSRTNRRR